MVGQCIPMIQDRATHHRRDHKKAEERNRTLLSFLKTIGRSAIRTRGSGQEAPRDAHSWPEILARYWRSASMRHEARHFVGR